RHEPGAAALSGRHHVRRHAGGLRACAGGEAPGEGGELMADGGPRRRGHEKILVIKLSALGDFVLALAAMKKIRQAHPKAHISLLTTPPFESLAKASPYFNAVFTDGRPEGFAQWLALRRRLRAANYTRVYDLQTSAQSNRIFQIMRPNPPPWSGIAFG